MKAIVMRAAGGLEVLAQQALAEPVAGPGQVLVQVAAAGVNFMDVGVRQGLYWQEMTNPKVIGVEGAGTVIAAGADVDDFAPGQRVAWAYAPGSYAERIALPAQALVRVPDAIDDRTAAAVMMQGLTASHFATDFYPVQPRDIALVHAAAGGVGQLLTQLVKLRGGTVIGRVSHADKVAAARAAGADHVIVDAEGRFAADVLRLTDGEGVHVVYDVRAKRPSRARSPRCGAPARCAGMAPAWASPRRSTCAVFRAASRSATPPSTITCPRRPCCAHAPDTCST